MSNPDQLARQFLLQRQHLRTTHKSQLSSLRSRITSLQSQLTTLTSQNSQLKSQLEHSRTTHQSFGKRVAQELRELKVLLKTRENDNYDKDVRIARLEREMEEGQRKWRENQREVGVLKTSYFNVSTAYKEQEKQLTQQTAYIEQLLAFIEEYCERNEDYIEQFNLLNEYKSQLETQIDQVEAINEKLLAKAIELKDVREELRLQNTQSNDLVNLAERMVEHLEK